MQKISFIKMSGAGNDFIFIDKNQNPAFSALPEQIKKLCHRRNGIGADGVIFIEDIPNYDYKMLYFNADGSEGSLCANGARCSIWFAQNSRSVKRWQSKIYF